VKWPWKQAQARPVKPRRAVSSNSNGKAMELQAAIEILAEAFGTWPEEVEEMIQRRLDMPAKSAWILFRKVTPPKL